MKRSVPRRALVLVCAAALALSACSNGGSPGRSEAQGGADPDVTASADPALARYYTQSPQWGDCSTTGDEQQFPHGTECAGITVPVDYAKPSGGDTTVQIARLKATGSDPQGALFLNPGGPGGSGVDMMASADYFTSADVRRNYDLVGFDPRGVGRSDGIRCLSDRELDEWRAEPAFDPQKESLAELRTSSREIGEKCHEHSSAVVSHMDTQSVARDLDVLRAALRQSATHYLGFSYGTEIGATYAHLFPARTGRMILDGAVDPLRDERSASLAQAEGFEDNLRHFVADCQETTRGCAVAGDGVDAGMDKIRRLLRTVAEGRTRTSDGRTVTATNALEGILVPLYSTTGYPQLNSALQQAFDGKADALMAFSDSNHGRDSSGKYTSNVSMAFTAVSCLDSSVAEVTDEQMAQAAREMSRRAPTFGPYLGYGAAACQGWPDKPVKPLPDYHADVTTPVMVIGTTHDPATPYAWAKSLSAQLGDARLLTYEGYGHTAYTSGDRCVSEAVDRYLLDGVLPDDGTTCGQS
ncbi:alpha/beta hydrolase [Kocuria tytonis]|uniref:Alpha/beta hydrolase n=1 Tax=Kocuria tytonis TaxID=2054280 RepID=A0A495A3D8_9MICC|nr:alpha/beta hydrolase [Kocuria tytonis]RKQ33631.1 alpha/beta hydrolase [Kocuria tytonis]